MSLKIGAHVERIANDYVGGRRGSIVEIKGERARVLWVRSRYGVMKPLRTWVRFRDLKALPEHGIVTSPENLPQAMQIAYAFENDTKIGYAGVREISLAPGTKVGILHTDSRTFIFAADKKGLAIEGSFIEEL
jgi:hypothetical protein